MSTTNADQTKRWISARDRAIKENVHVCQVESTGQWIATSGTKSGVAYAIDVTGNIAHGCDCPAGAAGDPVCKHRAAFYALIGAIPCSVDALESEEFARDAAATIACRPCCHCSGRGKAFSEYWLEARDCSWCAGTGSSAAVVA